MKYSVILAASCVLALSACGDGAVEPNIAYMNVSKDERSVSGRYHAQGFSEKEVKILAAVMCGGSLSSFGTRHAYDGIGFAANCSGQSPYGGHAGGTFYRKENGTAEGHITHSSNGSIMQEQVKVDL